MALSRANLRIHLRASKSHEVGFLCSGRACQVASRCWLCTCHMLVISWLPTIVRKPYDLHVIRRNPVSTRQISNLLLKTLRFNQQTDFGNELCVVCMQQSTPTARRATRRSRMLITECRHLRHLHSRKPSRASLRIKVSSRLRARAVGSHLSLGQYPHQ